MSGDIVAAIIGAIIGAFLAALFGIGSTLFLEKKASERQLKLTKRIIGNELRMIARNVDMLRKGANLRLPDGSQIGPSLCYSKLVPNNSLSTYYPYLVDVLDNQDLDIVDVAYREFTKCDYVMEIAIQSMMLLPGKNGTFSTETQQLIKLFWAPLLHKETQELLNKINHVADKLS